MKKWIVCRNDYDDCFIEADTVLVTPDGSLEFFRGKSTSMENDRYVTAHFKPEAWSLYMEDTGEE